MDPIVEQYLKENPKLAVFVRYNPQWYRFLSRNPGRIEEMEKEAKKFYGKTFPQQIENLNSRIQMVNMLAQVAKAMKD
ncbi:YlbE-like family protein [Oceanobacillus saliphilus]|uniref:YlbE-like family protein n=1 Tax=Oceanobacillus saliphilus TaxID=2925834 RepID=UPI00201D6AC0|nr:YlbE-like family protein [Oceanobacillus saliphilus]